MRPFQRLRLNCYYNYFTPLRVFQTSVILSDRKFHQLSMTLLSILVDLNYVAVWMVSNCFLISKSFSPCIYPLVTVPRAQISVGITISFMFHSFYKFSSKVQVLIFLFAFFQFYSVVIRDSKVNNSASYFFSWLLLGLVVWLRLSDPFVFQNPWGVCAFHFPGRSLGCEYTIYSYGQVSISCTFPSGSPCPHPPGVSSLVPFLC